MSGAVSLLPVICRFFMVVRFSEEGSASHRWQCMSIIYFGGLGKHKTDQARDRDAMSIMIGNIPFLCHGFQDQNEVQPIPL